MKKSPALYIIKLMLTFIISGYVCTTSDLVFSQEEDAGLGSRDAFESQLPEKELKSEAPPRSIERAEPVSPPQIIVGGLVAGGRIPQAIIQGKVLRVGDEVEDSVITAITRDGVEVFYKAEKFLIPAPSKLMGNSIINTEYPSYNVKAAKEGKR